MNNLNRLGLSGYLESSRDDALLWQIIFDALHCKRFSTSSLAVSKHGAIVSLADLDCVLGLARCSVSVRTCQMWTYALDQGKADVCVDCLGQAVQVIRSIKSELFGRSFGFV